ncbi:MAG: hypothetical protein EOL87_08585 [Spartobacteria bacterium]|nr:hypothetical protein [Spartobacteria bacterium]
MKTFWLFVGCALISGAVWAAEEGRDVFDSFIRDGKYSGSVGVAANLIEMKDSGQSGAGLMWGFVDMKYETPEIYGLKLGVWWLGAKNIWENHAGDYDSVFKQESDLRNLYGTWTAPETKTSLQAGRFKMKPSPVLDGCAHQAVQLAVEDLELVQVYIGAANRWINNSRTDMEAKGISGWDDISVGGQDAGDEVVNGLLVFSPAKGLSIAPYVTHQTDLMTVLGCSADYSYDISSESSVDFQGIYARYGNNVPESVAPDYDDCVHSWLLHVAWNYDIYTVGAGTFGLSDNKGEVSIGIFDTFDPMTEDSSIIYDANNHASLYYVDASIDLNRVEITAAYGYGDNQAIDCQSNEIDMNFTFHLTTSVALEAYLAWNNYSDGKVADYTQMGTSLTYRF